MSNQETEIKTKNVKLGPCKITYGGVDLGYTKGGVEVTVETSTYQVQVDQFGETPIDEFITGRTVTVSAPLAETTMENLVAIMPGATMVEEGGDSATGTVTLTNNPADGDTITLNSVTLTFKDTPSLNLDVAIGADAFASAAALQSKLTASVNPKLAVADYTVANDQITIDYKTNGIAGNEYTMETTSSAITLSGSKLTGGVNGEKRVEVTNAVGVSLLENAKELKLHPIANADDNYRDDFVCPKAGVAGALNYSYMIDQERTYPTEFKAYPSEGDLQFYVGAPKETNTTSL